MWAAAAAVAAVTHAAYAPTRFRTVPGGDAGELVAEACQLGVGHPPGYPLYIVLARAAIQAFRHLPTPADRVNYASVLFGCAAAAGVHVAVVNTVTAAIDDGGPAATLRGWPLRLLAHACGVVAAATFAASPLTWLYSVSAEVFALNNALVAALRRQGHETLMVPLYLPLTLDEPDQSAGMPTFFGGINVYLQEKFWLFRHTPTWFDRLLDSNWLLNWVSRFAASTQASNLGDLTISMLQGTHGKQAKEVEELVQYLKDERPDVVLFTLSLIHI